MGQRWRATVVVPPIDGKSRCHGDAKLLHVELGPLAAHAVVRLFVSNTTPGDGPLMVVEGVSVPIVPDAYTNAFDQMFPTLSVTADGSGVADIAFPPLTDLSWEGVDLNVAALAANPVTGAAVAASTFVQVQLRNPNVCQ